MAFILEQVYQEKDKTDEMGAFKEFLKEEIEKTWNFKGAKRIPL